MKRDDLVWSDRKRNWLGLPWTFTVYGLTEDRLFIKTGVLNIHEDEVRLYRILDLSLRKTLWQRIMGLGTIHVDSLSLIHIYLCSLLDIEPVVIQ